MSVSRRVLQNDKSSYAFHLRLTDATRAGRAHAGGTRGTYFCRPASYFHPPFIVREDGTGTGTGTDLDTRIAGTSGEQMYDDHPGIPWIFPLFFCLLGGLRCFFL
jgi:hypothetical protein